MKRIILLLIILLMLGVFFFVSAQNSRKEIVTDRPDQTESPMLVIPGAFQIETGFFLSAIGQVA